MIEKRGKKPAAAISSVRMRLFQTVCKLMYTQPEHMSSIFIEMELTKTAKEIFRLYCYSVCFVCYHLTGKIVWNVLSNQMNQNKYTFKKMCHHIQTWNKLFTLAFFFCLHWILNGKYLPHVSTPFCCASFSMNEKRHTKS